MSDSVHPAVRPHDETGEPAVVVNAAFTTHPPDLDRAVVKGGVPA